MRAVSKVLDKAIAIPVIFCDAPPTWFGCSAQSTFFPKGYELEGESLNQLWMATLLIDKESMEDIGTAYLRRHCEFEGIVSCLRKDYGNGKKWYKVNRT